MIQLWFDSRVETRLMLFLPNKTSPSLPGHCHTAITRNTQRRAWRYAASMRDVSPRTTVSEGLWWLRIIEHTTTPGWTPWRRKINKHEGKSKNILINSLLKLSNHTTVWFSEQMMMMKNPHNDVSWTYWVLLLCHPSDKLDTSKSDCILSSCNSRSSSCCFCSRITRHFLRTLLGTTLGTIHAMTKCRPNVV